MDATKHFSTRDTARILESNEARVRTSARLGGVPPEPGPGGRPEFTFQQLLLLRTTRGLLEAGIPARRVRRIWSSLRRQLAGDLPLTSIRILADGDRAVAWDGNAPWQPDSGQFLLEFDAGEIPGAGEVAGEGPIRTDAGEAPRLSAEQWFHLGCELENTSPVESRQAYMHALYDNPHFANAHLKLGTLINQAGELVKS